MLPGMHRQPDASRLTWALVVLGVGLVVLGVLLWGADSDAAFGWFSYEPVDEQVLSQMVFMSGRRWSAVAALASGLLLLSGVAGFRLGTRRSRDLTD
jgi:hypothetical protein